MCNYTEAIKRPFQDLRKLVIGIFLSLIPIVNLIAYGYILENAKSAMKKNYKLTEWDNFGDLFTKGLLFVVIGVIYAIPALLVLAFTGLTFGAAAIQGLVQSKAAFLSALPVFGTGFILFAILAIIACFLTPAAVLNYVSKNKFSAAFEISRICKKACTKKYFVAWVLGMLYMLVLMAIMIPFLSIIFVIPFIGMMTVYTLLAEAFGGK